MSETKFNIPESLEIALKNKKVVLFVGAGVSIAVKKSPLEPSLDKNGDEKKDKLGKTVYKSIFPGWWEFISNSADKLEREKIALNSEGTSQKAVIIRTLLNDSPIDYLDIAQRAFDALGNRHWGDLLIENFEKDIDSADEDSKKLARLMWQFGNNLVLTTNVDRVLETVHEKPQQVKVLDTQSSEFADIQTDWYPPRPTVLHIHGQIDDKENVIFTKNQYDAFYNLEKNQAKLDTLRKILSQRTILFIGFSLDDLFILKELERVNLIYKGGANRFYALIHEDQKNSPHIPDYVQQINFLEFGKPLEDLAEELTRIAKKDAREKSENSNGDNVNLLNTSRSSDKEPFFNVPFASKEKEFVGRAGNLEEIWNSLNLKSHSPISNNISIRGFGGWGKTQLAVEYAHEYRSKYKNGIFWLTADENIENQLLIIAEKKRGINQFDKTVNHLEVAKDSFLEVSESLIIFDNVEEFDSIKNYIPKSDLQNHILITSRENISEFRQFHLELLNLTEARELLLKISNRQTHTDIESKQIEELLEILGGIPLAIELVGGYLSEHETVTFEKYRQFLNEYPLPKLEEAFPASSFTNHERSIVLTLRISQKLLDEKPLMVEILKVLAWSGNSSMGLSLLQELVKVEDDFELQNAIGDAHKLRLLIKDGESERYTVHRLLAKAIRHENPLENMSEWHQKIAVNMEKWFYDHSNDYVNLTEFEVEIEHLLEWQKNTFELLPEYSVGLFYLEYFPFYLRGNYQNALNVLEKTFSFYATYNLSNREFLAKINNSLGRIHNNLGNLVQSLNFFLQALLIRQDLFGTNHLETAESLNDIALTYSALGDYDLGLNYSLQALEIKTNLLGNSSREVATSLTNIGSCYVELGNYNEALKYLFQSLEIQRDLFGEKHPNFTATLNNIGTAYLKLGNANKTLEFALPALEIQKELFSDMHPNIAILLNTIASAYGSLGNRKEAINYFLQALEINKKTFGSRNISQATLSNNIGECYFNLGDYREALNYFTQGFDIQHEILGEKHPDSAVVAANLITVYIKVGKLDDAGKLAARFVDDIPNKHPHKQLFEKFGRAYKKVAKRKKKRKK